MSINMNFTPQNATNTSADFSCTMSDLNQSTITNDSIWSLNNNLLFDTPLVATVKLLVFLLTFITSLLVVLFSYKQGQKQRQYPFTAFVVNMAIADVLYSVTLLIFAISPEIIRRFAFGGNDSARCGVCAFAGFLLIFFSSVSLHAYACIIAQRVHFFMCIFRAGWWKKKCTKIVFILLVWFVSFWIAIPPVLGFGHQHFDRDFGACIPRLDGMSMTGIPNRSYVGFLFIEALIFMGFILVGSVLMMRSLVKHITRYSDRSGRQRMIETFLTLLSSIIPWIPIAVITIVIIAVPPSSLSKEVYIACWLCYISNTVFRIPEYAVFLRLEF